MSRDSESEKLIFDIIHELKTVAQEFSKTYQYLRRRRDCPGTKNFAQAIERLDGIMDRGIKFIKERYDE